VYRSLGLDLAKAHGDDSWTLPMPARFVIDGDGVIRSADVDPDYTRRTEPSDTIAALEALARGSAR
jgi:peroxiredoxin